MKKILESAFLACAMLASVSQAQIRSELSLPPNGDNERAEVSQWIGPVKVTVDYHSPNLHGGGGADRTGHIWGEVVRYGFFDEGFGPSHATPWRVGANETTTISFSDNVKVEGKDLKAGTYGLFLAVEKSGPWTWIFSSDSAGWGGYQYDPKNDVLRVSVVPQDVPNTEFLTFGFDERRPSSAVAYMQWEKKRVPFKIEVANVNQLYVDAMRKELLSWPGFNYQNWQTAAQFCASNKINLEEALLWADKAINEPFRGAVQGRADFSTFQTKAAVLQAMGRSQEADAVMDKALHMAGADLLPVHAYGTRLLNAGRKEKALEIFKFNQQQHPDEKFYTYVGLARAYTAMSERENAIKNWEIALKNVPPEREAQRATFESALKKLKEGS